MRHFLPLLPLSTVWAQPTPIYIRNARVIDGTGVPAREGTVVVVGTRIAAYGKETGPAPANAKIVDAVGQTLLPGFFDLHTHLTASAVTGVAGDWGKTLKAYLASGVTSVNDYATYSELFWPMRQLLATGTLMGPRINMAV